MHDNLVKHNIFLDGERDKKILRLKYKGTSHQTKYTGCKKLILNLIRRNQLFFSEQSLLSYRPSVSEACWWSQANGWRWVSWSILDWSSSSGCKKNKKKQSSRQKHEEWRRFSPTSGQCCFRNENEETTRLWGLGSGHACIFRGNT